MKPLIHAVFVLLSIITILALLLTACGPIDHGKGGPDDDNDKGKDNVKDKGKSNDLEPNTEKVTLCHKTGSAKNPYVEITISKNGAANGHTKHEGDLIPAPAGGCPTQ